MQTVIVTGAAGFIGSHVCEALLARGDAVVGVDAFTAHYDPARKRANLAAVERAAGARPGGPGGPAGAAFRFVEGDVRDRTVLDDLFSSGSKKVVHLAARAGVRGALDQAADYVSANLVATTEVLEACRRHGLGGREGHLVMASSSTVYGSGPAGYDGPFTEDLAADEPLSVYGATKRGCELLAHAYARLAGLRVTCLRFFGVVGPRVRTDLSAFGFVDAVANGRPITTYGDGTTARDYTYVGDVVAGILAALDRFERAAAGLVAAGGDYECVNLGNDRPVTLNHYLAALGRLMDREVLTVPAPEHPMDAKRTWADLAKARRLLGYAPTTTFEDALARVIDWYQTEINPAATRPTQPPQEASTPARAPAQGS